MKRTLAFGAATTQGTWPVQEDGFFADPVGGRFALTDGFGGRNAGDISARLALDEFRKPESSLHEAQVFMSAHRAITARNQTRPPGARGGSSLVAATLRHGELLLGQCGTCAAFLVREGRVRPLLLPQASPREEYLPLLADQALGLPTEPRVELRRLAFRGGDILCLASGGVEWEGEGFQADLLGRLAVRTVGDDLSGLAAHLIENSGLSTQGWNRTLVLVEAL